MPAGDGTGPMGMGSITGRGMGYCTGYDAPGWSNPRPGRYYGRGYYGRGGGGWGGYGYGRGGGGRGWQNWSYATRRPRWGYPPVAYGGAYGSPYAPPSPEQEVEMLKGEAEWLKEQLDAISQRMDDPSQE